MSTPLSDAPISLPGGFVTELRRLNVGCGFDIREGYINVDMNDFHGPDVVADIVDLDGFPSGAFDEVFAKDVIEHFLWCLTPVALQSWNRVLRKGGRLVVTTTYLPGLAQRILSPEYQADLPLQQLTLINLFSSQSYPGDFHYTAFTERQLRFHAHRAGFDVADVVLVGGWLIQMTMVKIDDRQNSALTDGDDESFIRRMYLEFLGREPETEGMARWIKGLSSGELDRRGLRAVIIGGLERQNLDQKDMAAFDPGPLTTGI